MAGRLNPAQRYLLFNASCFACTGLARTIERESNGWLTTGGLQNPAMQALLTRARPEWRWEPTLVEIRGERVRAFTGLRLRTKLLTGLGPRRAARVAQLVLRTSTPASTGLSRRVLLRVAAALAGGAVLQSTTLGSVASAASAGVAPDCGCVPPDCNCVCNTDNCQAVPVDCGSYCPDCPDPAYSPCYAPLFIECVVECCNYPGTVCGYSLEQVGDYQCC